MIDTTKEEAAQRRIDSWHIPELEGKARFHGIENNHGSTSVWFDRHLQRRVEGFDGWLFIEAHTDSIRINGSRRLREVTAGVVLSPIPADFEEVVKWLRMVVNLTQG